MLNSSGMTSSIEGVLALIASREDAVGGLRALAEETGGRCGKRYRVLAERIERGELPLIAGASETTPNDDTKRDAASSTLRASASPVASLTRYALLQRSRSKSRSHLIAVTTLGWIYLLCSLAVGLFVLRTAAPIANQFIADLGVDDRSSDEIAAAINFYCGLYITAIVVLVVMGMLFVVRLLPRAPRPVEWLWDHVPMIGSTLRAIDLSEMAESLYQSLLAGQTFATAFGSASQSTRSTSLRRWLVWSKKRSEAGETLHTIARDLPMRGEFIGGVFNSLASIHSAASVTDLWRETSLRMHSLMLSRGGRLRTVMAPVLVVISMLLASFALVLSLGTLYRVIELISTFIYY